MVLDPGELKVFVREAVKKGWLVIACKGRARARTLKEALSIAKQPINLPKGFPYERGLVNPSISKHTLSLVECGAVTSVAVPGINNLVFWLDIDPGGSKMIGDISKWFDPREVYIERTPRGGYHVALLADVEREFVGVKGVLDVKYRGYCITAPSILLIDVVGRGTKLLRYERVSTVELFDTAPLSKYLPIVEKLVGFVGGLEAPPSISAGGKPIVFHPPSSLRHAVSKLSVEELLVYAQAVFEEIGCGDCTRRIISSLVSGDPLPVPQATYPIRVERGLHTVFEVELLGALWALGADEDQIYEVAERISYENHETETPPIKNARYNTSRGIVSIAYAGACPLGIARALKGGDYPSSCHSTLARRCIAEVRKNLVYLVRLALSIPRAMEQGQPA